MRRSLVLGAGVLAGAGLAIGLVGTRAGRERSTAARADETATPPASVTAVQVAELRGEIAGVRAELALAKAGAVRPTGAAAVEEPPGLAPPRGAMGAALAEKAAERFAHERPDPAWSTGAATAITRDLDAAGWGGALRGVSCLSTMCKIELALEDPELRDNLSERLTDLEAFRTQLLYVHHEGDPPSVTLFAARPGQPLPM